jgi:hypothetical protein
LGLRGGVWPGVTWWLALAAGHYFPEVLVLALRHSIQHMALNPRDHHAVPGQFAEWLDGESLINRGMRLSPWEPPRYLWAALEGVCGLTPLPTRLRARPLLPAAWTWLSVRRYPYSGHEHALFVTRLDAQRLRYFSTVDLEVAPEHEVEVFAEDVTARVGLTGLGAHGVVLRRPGCVLVAIGSTSGQRLTASLHLAPVLDPGQHYIKTEFTSALPTWSTSTKWSAANLSDLAVTVEPQGCCVVVLRNA